MRSEKKGGGLDKLRVGGWVGGDEEERQAFALGEPLGFQRRFEGRELDGGSDVGSFAASLMSQDSGSLNLRS
jgi:hypothetical protein